MASQQMERTAKLQDLEVRAKLNRRVRECERKCFASGRLGSISQASACAGQLTTRKQIGGCWCGSTAKAAHRRCNPARQSCRRLRECADRVSAAHAREQWRLSREQENPEVRGEVGLANQSSPIGFFHESTTSSNSYSSPIIRARPQITAGITSSAILYPLQSPASFFVTHGISSSSSSSYRRFCSLQEFTFRPFSSTTKATPRFALIH
jgi:hypothetical protein